MAAEKQQLCTFFLDDLFFGVPVESIQEIIRGGIVTPVPRAPAHVRGLMNLRGQIVAVLDLRKKLQMPAGPEVSGRKTMNVLVRAKGGPVSLLVDRIGDVAYVSSEEFEPAPETLRPPLREALRGAYKLPGCLLLALEVNKCTD